jgi:hypothetical protein
VLRASIKAEEAGIRSTSIVTSGFAGQARAVAKAFGMPGLSLAEYPGVILTDSEDVFSSKVAGPVVDGILEGLAARLGQAPPVPSQDPHAIVFTGRLEDVQDHFIARLWSDGLPIIPPTVERVRTFLRFTNRREHEVLGTLLPDRRAASVWDVAVNGVMAGCRPEYMPILVAAAEAIADPAFRIEDGGSTPGWEPIVIVSGPVSRDLGFNSGAGLSRVGSQPNASVGRFLRLFMRNIAGLRTPPGTTDKATIGMNFNVAIAENEAAVEAIGWTTFGEDRGYKRSDDIVTVQSVVAVSGPIYSAGPDPTRHLDAIVDVFGKTCAHWAYTGPKFGQFHPLIIMSPSVASVLATEHRTKDTIRMYLHTHATMEAARMRFDSVQASGNEVDLEERVRAGIAPTVFAEPWPGGLVPIFPWPESIGIIVAGDGDRNQSKGLCNNHAQGAPVSRPISLLPNWRKLRAAHSHQVEASSL